MQAKTLPTLALALALPAAAAAAPPSAEAPPCHHHRHHHAACSSADHRGGVRIDVDLAGLDDLDVELRDLDIELDGLGEELGAIGDEVGRAVDEALGAVDWRAVGRTVGRSVRDALRDLGRIEVHGRDQPDRIDIEIDLDHLGAEIERALRQLDRLDRPRD